MQPGQKISGRVAGMRTLPKGIDRRSACRHPDWAGPDDREIEILELREITDWQKPIYNHRRGAALPRHRALREGGRRRGGARRHAGRHPCLLQAAIVAAGLDGPRTKADPGRRWDIDMYTEGHKVTGAPTLPVNLRDALHACDRDRKLTAAPGATVSSACVKPKLEEWNSFVSHFTRREHESTLDVQAGTSAFGVGPRGSDAASRSAAARRGDLAVEDRARRIGEGASRSRSKHRGHDQRRAAASARAA
jgi:hypothetical protein